MEKGLYWDAWIGGFIDYDGVLIVGGWFTQADGDEALCLAAWNGNDLQPFGGPVRGTVNAVAIYKNDLIVAGSFTAVGGIEASNIARWDGSRWYALGRGADDRVEAMHVFDDDLYVGGAFTRTGGELTSAIARWDGSNWHPVGTGFSAENGNWNLSVKGLTEYRGECDTAIGLDVEAGCPGGGRIDIAWSGASPSGRAAIVFASNTGHYVVTQGPCSGTTLGLGSSRIRLAEIGDSDANGDGHISATARAGACGGYLQLLDLTTCTTSNVARIE